MYKEQRCIITEMGKMTWSIQSIPGFFAIQLKDSLNSYRKKSDRCKNSRQWKIVSLYTQQYAVLSVPMVKNYMVPL